MKKILIIEAYAILFKAQKLTVYEASDGKVALSQLKTNKPDIIVLDLFMPVMGGVEFLQAAKLKEKYPKVKVLVLSNLSDPKTIGKLEQLGATKCLLKSSLSPNELVEAVKKHL